MMLRFPGCLCHFVSFVVPCSIIDIFSPEANLSMVSVSTVKNEDNNDETGYYMQVWYNNQKKEFEQTLYFEAPSDLIIFL